MTNSPSPSRLVSDELTLLAELVPLGGTQIIELGCGAAALARELVVRYPGAQVTGLEVDERQHAKNVAAPQPGITFMAACAQAVPLGDAQFDLALMLKSLHHVPVPLMAQALAEVARLLKPDGHLYVSEPVFAGPLNEVMRLFHDEQEVRAAAQAALDAALVTGQWTQAAEVRFDMPVSFTSFADFEQRMMRPTFADHRISNAKLAEVRHAFEPHCTAEGAWFERPMHVRLLTKTG